MRLPSGNETSGKVTTSGDIDIVIEIVLANAPDVINEYNIKIYDSCALDNCIA